MAKQITFGLSEIALGNIASDGGVATTFESIGYTYKDSCSIDTADPEKTEHYVEEQDDPLVVTAKKGKTTLKWQIADPGLETLKELCGGEATATDWSAPTTLPVIEKSVKITPKQGFETVYARVSIVAKWIPSNKQGGIGLLDVTGDVLTPKKSGVPSCKVNTLSE